MTPGILKKFHAAAVEKQPHEIVETAGKLIAEELRQCDFFKVGEHYPGFASENFSSNLDAGNQSVPLLYRLLKAIIVRKSHRDSRITSLIHALVHANRPRSTLPALQLGLAVQLHHTEGTRRVIEQLYRMGFCASYTQAKNFERSSAVSFDGIAKFFLPDRSLQFSGDNVDYIPDTLHGKNSIHCMGIIGIITPGCSMGSTLIKRESIDTSRVLQLTKDNIQYLKNNIDQAQFFADEKYRKLLSIEYSGSLCLLTYFIKA